MWVHIGTVGAKDKYLSHLELKWLYLQNKILNNYEIRRSQKLLLDNNPILWYNNYVT